MEKINPTRHEATIQSPDGDSFLSIDTLVPEFVQNLMANLSQYRRRSKTAQEKIKLHQENWDRARKLFTRNSYGEELNTLISERAVESSARIQSIEVQNDIVAMEGLYEHLFRYNDAVSAIRNFANKASGTVAQNIKPSIDTTIGLHSYTSMIGAHNDIHLVRRNNEANKDVVFTWSGVVDTAQYKQANLNDQLVLLSDLLLHADQPDNSH